jgi:predicted phosphodiesterase
MKIKLLYGADFHLRADRPRCRTEADWMATQAQALAWLADCVAKYKAPLLVGGDIFNTPQTTATVLGLLVNLANDCAGLGYGMSIIAGNHDLPYHDWALVDSCAYGVVNKIPSLFNPPTLILPDLSWSHFGEASEFRDDAAQIQLVHELVFPSKKDMPPNVNATSAADLLDRWPAAEIVLTGDYHQAFHFEQDGRHVINPGCLLRQTADLIDYKPGIFLLEWDTAAPGRTLKATQLLNPGEANTDLVDDSYLRREEVREERITAFAERVKMSGRVSLSFEDNVEAALKDTPMDADTTKMIQKLMGGHDEV